MGYYFRSENWGTKWGTFSYSLQSPFGGLIGTRTSNRLAFGQYEGLFEPGSERSLIDRFRLLVYIFGILVVFNQIVMKNLLTCSALGLAFVAGAQHMPYNPDANADLFIGVDDVLGILGLYDTPLMQSELTCDYEGTELESLIVGAISGDIILDSVYVEYLIYDTLTYYTPGCPDLVVEPIVLERSYMMFPDGIYESGGLLYHNMGCMHFGFSRQQKITYNEQNNQFNFYLRDHEVGELPSYSDYGYWWSDSLESSGSFALPFPSEFEINEDGYQVFGVPYEFPVNAENFRAIPFWHNAE